jgi:hypothetical protein
MIPSFEGRAKRYVQRSPQCKKLPDFAKERLIKDIARLMSQAYKDGFVQGTAEPKDSSV